MSLETVIKIGSIYRQSNQGLQRHRYINQTQRDIDAFLKNKDADGNIVQTTIYAISVLEKDNRFFFDLENKTIVLDEDVKKKLMYLNFKTSDKDSDKKYLFGDIIYSNFKDKKGEINENGNYRLAKVEDGVVKKKSSFFRSEEVAASLAETVIEKFRKEFERNIENIESILNDHLGVGLHFVFEEDKNWFELEGVMDLINKKLMEEFVFEDPKTKVISLQKSLFKTIAGVVKSDAVGGVTPDFKKETAFKVKAFKSIDDVINLLYAIGIAEYVKVSVSKDLGIVVLPNSSDMTVRQLSNFYGFKGFGNEQPTRKKNLKDTIEEENDLLEDLEDDETDHESDALFTKLVVNEFNDDVTFDLVFIKPAGMSTPSVDLIEISSIEKTLLKEINQRINLVKKSLIEQFSEENPKEKKSLQLELKYSFKNILSDKTKAEKKYHAHILKVLPQIYSDTYFQDPILLPAFIEKAERNIRNDEQKFRYFKYDFYFLMNIQKFDNMVEIYSSKSFRLGQQLGMIAKPMLYISNSFDRSFIGQLSKKTTSISEVEKRTDEIIEKLCMHRKYGKNQKEAYNEFMKILQEQDVEPYNKHRFGLGFFESIYTKNQEQNESENE